MRWWPARSGFVLAAFTIGIGAAAGRLGFDSLLQRDGPDAVRGRAFAKFETRFQLVWVIGGIIAIIPFAKQMGLFLLAIVLGFAAVSYVAALRAARGRRHAHEAAARGGRPHDLATRATTRSTA